MKIFEIKDGEVRNYGSIEQYELKNSDVKIDCIRVGEEGRGRRTGIIPLKKANGNETNKIENVIISSTKSGKPKLEEVEEIENTDKCIIVFRTPIGFRGSNSHTGDRKGKTQDEHLQFYPFPGEILVTGVIAQGQAGGMGSGYQLIAIIPKNVVFRTGYSGRRYGRPTAHYYIFNGKEILSCTWEERELTDIF